MSSTPRALYRQRSKLSVLFTSTVRVLFTTLLFTAGGMGLGLLLGIIGMITYGLYSFVMAQSTKM